MIKTIAIKLRPLPALVSRPTHRRNHIIFYNDRNSGSGVAGAGEYRGGGAEQPGQELQHPQPQDGPSRRPLPPSLPKHARTADPKRIGPAHPPGTGAAAPATSHLAPSGHLPQDTDPGRKSSECQTARRGQRHGPEALDRRALQHPAPVLGKTKGQAERVCRHGREGGAAGE